MTTTPRDRSGATVTVDLVTGNPVSSYTVRVEEGAIAGRADFVEPPGSDHERIFFHTEVDEKYGGRGLAGLLVREALADSLRGGVTVVPVCPFFARHLQVHGSEYAARGGVVRRPTPADLALVRRAVGAGA